MSAIPMNMSPAFMAFLVSMRSEAAPTPAVRRWQSQRARKNGRTPDSSSEGGIFIA
jgi:hypothetical protein